MIAKDLEAKIGQMIMVGFRESELTPDLPVVRALRDFSLGGVILYNIDLRCYLEGQKTHPAMTRGEAALKYPRNILSPVQLQELTGELQGYSRKPLLIAVDMEGGLVSRLGPAAGFPESPSPRALGEKDDEGETARAAGAMAQEMGRCGINLNLAPVVDLDLNPRGLIARSGRSFGADVEKVCRHARAFIRAHRRHGILTTLKHFPGKGSAGEDTHFDVADVTSCHEEREFVPFSRLIADGLADAVMTAHVHHLDWDGQYPATLSRKILQGLLRERMNYRGVIISDDLQMGAIVKRFSLEEACLLAVEAGVDILLASNNSPEGYVPDLWERMRGALVEGVGSGRIPPAMIEAAHGRIQALKERLSQ